MEGEGEGLSDKDFFFLRVTGGGGGVGRRRGWVAAGCTGKTVLPYVPPMISHLYRGRAGVKQD